MNERATESGYHGSEVAVIGMACRVPGAKNLEELWRNLCDGVESITFFSDEELLAAGIDRRQLADPDYVKAAPILDDVDAFDAEFFDYSPRDAELMDPQQRLFLELAWEAVEHAGYAGGGQDGEVGVFAGGQMSTYVFNLVSQPGLTGSMTPIEIGLGTDIALLATRVSYKLDLKGPSYFVQSACSTSLVAIHLACQSLLLDECRMALAGAVAVEFPHKRGYLYRPGSLSSVDGHVRAFDAGASGSIFGSGLGVVVLKRLEDALDDGDRIYAVIKGSATNNDGAAKANYTAPSVEGEARVILEALVNADVSPETISYLEAHGTGTDLGDPIEIRALTKAYRAAGARRSGYCALGSAKTNLGHLNAAAGVSGLIKTVLALDRRRLPPSLNYTAPNPKIDFASSPFYVQTELADWPAGAGPRRAGVSSFGFGGTNTHLVVEEAPAAVAGGPSRPWQLLVLSARSEAALEAASRNLGEHLRQHPELDLADVAFTLKRGRREFRHRRAVVCGDRERAVAALEELDPRWVQTGLQRSAERPVAFLFPGQGSQRPGMGRELYRSEATFRRHLDAGAEILRPHLGVDLRTLLYPEGEGAAAVELEPPALAEPALAVVEHALARLWMEWGVHPRAMIGHGIGEVVAACLAGVLSLDDALALAAARGRSLQLSPPAPQGALQLSPPAPQGALQVSAPAPDPEPFLAVLATVSLQAPQIPFLSTVTGTWIGGEEAVDPEYWAQHLLSTGRFDAGLGELLQDPERVLLEVGPGNALTARARKHPRRLPEQPVLASLPGPRERQPELAFLLTTVGRLWLAGVEIDGAGFYSRERRLRVPLPTYPFERKRYWVAPQAGPAADPRGAGRGPMRKNPEVSSWFYLPAWRASLAPRPAAGELAGEAGSWLVFVGDSGADGGAGAVALIERLKAAGQRVVAVRAGERFAAPAGGEATIDPRRSADYRRLIAELDLRPERVLHLWNLAPIPPGSAEERFRAAQDRGYYSLLYLARALAAAGPGDARLVVASTGLHDVSGLEPFSPERSTLLGPVMVIPQEHQEVTVLSLDFESGLEGEELAERILSEALAPAADPVVAWRGRRRWVQHFESAPLEAGAAPIRPWRQGGVVLITGGLGGVGLHLAEHLARSGAKLALLGRSALPPRDQWPEHLARTGEAPGGDDAASRKIRQILALEELGAEVLLASADVADRRQMRSVIEEIDRRFGALHGVIHGAGILQGESIYRPLVEIGRAGSEAQFGPKVYGLYVLEEVLAGRDLDFCLLLSSNTSVFGGLGFVAYAAANLFMDAFAADRARGGLPWISSNWDQWPGAVAPGERQLQTSMTEFSMTHEESLDAFERVVTGAPSGQVVVATGALEARREVWIRRTPAEVEDDGSRHERPDLDTGYVAPGSEIEKRLAEIWQQALGVSQVGVDDNFFELGGHSLMATQILSRLRKALEVDVPLELFFEAPTVSGLAERVEAVRWAALGQAGLDDRGKGEREEGDL